MFLRLAAAALATGTSLFVHAQGQGPLEQLSSGQIQTVETTYADLQSRFERGTATEIDLLDAYSAFYQKEDRYREQFDSWIKAFPRSAAAHTAQGVYLRRLGDARRGTSYIAKVPPENLKYMQQMHALATKDLTTALTLNPKAYIAVLHLLNIANFGGDDLKAFRYLNLGNEILPSNLLVRARYLVHLTPRWGGSWKEMEVFIKQQQVNGASAERIEQLRSIMYYEQGRLAHENGQYGTVREFYAKALELSKSGGPWFRNYYLRHTLWICKEPQFSSKEYCL